MSEINDLYRKLESFLHLPDEICTNQIFEDLAKYLEESDDLFEQLMRTRIFIQADFEEVDPNHFDRPVLDEDRLKAQEKDTQNNDIPNNGNTSGESDNHGQ